MILLISQDSAEYSTDEVENWLHSMDADYTRINGSDIVRMSSMSVAIDTADTSAKFILKNGAALILSEINIVWYRRWQYFPDLDTVSETGDLLFENDINDYRRREFKALSRIFFNLIKGKRMIGTLPDYISANPTKFEQLDAAKLSGLKVPKSLITNDKKDLLEFYDNLDGKVITKPYGESTWLTIGEKTFATYTTLVTNDVINKLPDIFHPSLFQEFIDKEIELRIFYLNKRCYAMAIFSTLDKQTEVDFRVYNNQKPNRTGPFSLPAEIQQKITVFMENMGLLTGSLDMILSKKNEFIFLEVNPVGQFGMVSYPCNYNLEKVIADELIKYDSNLN